MTEKKNLKFEQGGKMPYKNEDTLPDEDIIDLYWERQERAITETDKKYGKYLFTIAYNIVHDRLDCEECLNDTYLGTWNSIPPTRPAVFNVFLSKIIRNIAIDKVRKETAGKKVPSELIISMEELDECMLSDVSGEEEMLIGKISTALNTFLRTLSDREEFIFVCRYYYSDSISSIAKMLQLNVKTVSRELSSIRGRLREFLEKEEISV